MSECTVNTRDELYAKLNEMNYGESVTSGDAVGYGSEYALIQYKDKENDITELVYFMPYQGVYFESPCSLSMHKFEGDEDAYVKQYVMDMYGSDSNEGETEMGRDEYEAAFRYEKSMVRDGVHYEIENFQTLPFIGMPCTIIKIMNEQEALDYLINEMNAYIRHE